MPAPRKRPPETTPPERPPVTPPGSTPPRRSPAPSAPPRTSGSSPTPLLFGLWPGSRQAPPAPGPSCLSPGSSLLRRLPGLCLPAPSRVSVLLLSLLLSSHPPLPFGCFYGARTHLPGGGVMSGSWTVFVVFLLPMCSVTQFLPHVNC